MVAILALIVAGTNPLAGTWNYRATSADGKVIATGKIVLHEVTPKERKKDRISDDITVIGTKAIRCVDASKYGPHGGNDFPGMPPKIKKIMPSEQVGGGMRDGKVHLDLNYHWNDANIWLTGDLKGRKITGGWGWATVAGIRVKGNFELQRANS